MLDKNKRFVIRNTVGNREVTTFNYIHLTPSQLVFTPEQEAVTREVVERIRAHLLKQGEPATTPDGSCMYLTEEGKQCAVGCLISPEAYHDDLEEHNVNYVGVIRALIKSGFDVGYVPNLESFVDDHSLDDNKVSPFLLVLGMCQTIHDNSPIPLQYGGKAMYEQFINIAFDEMLRFVFEEMRA